MFVSTVRWGGSSSRAPCPLCPQISQLLVLCKQSLRWAGLVQSHHPEEETESGEWRLILGPTLGLLLRPGARSLAGVLVPFPRPLDSGAVLPPCKSWLPFLTFHKLHASLCLRLLICEMGRTIVHTF